MKQTGRPKRAVIRYFGGKYRLAPWVVRHFPVHRTYTEAFGGAASVLMAKPRTYAEIFNDLDGEVVNLFRVLRDSASAAELERLLRLTPFARDEFRAAYELTENPIEQARRTVVKSFMGFGANSIGRGTAAAAGFNCRLSTNPPTGFRGDSNRSGTTPAHDWRNYPDAIWAFAERLKGVVIDNRDALDVIAGYDRTDTLHYVDPPYVPDTRRSHVAYRYDMTDDQHRELAALLRSVQGFVVLSGYRSALYDELYAEWQVEERPHRADGARPTVEALWLSRRTAESLPRTLFDLGAA